MLRVWLLAIALAPGVAAAAEPFAPVLGKFTGASTQISGREQSSRDLTVEITKSPDGKGFLVGWKTVIHKASGKDEEQPADKVRFIATRRANI
jgi:hypothetical protein